MLLLKPGPKNQKTKPSFLKFSPMLLLLSSEKNVNFNSYTESRMEKFSLLCFHAQKAVDLSWNKGFFYTKDFRRKSKGTLIGL